jgi:branched-chain amino acid transport system permease protein
MNVAQLLIDSASLSGIYVLMALGVALLFGMLRLINFAHGSIIMVAAYAVWALRNAPWPVLIIGTLATGAVLALILEFCVFRPIRRRASPVDPATLLIASFGASFFIQEFVITTIGSQPKVVGLGGKLGSAIEVGGLRIARVDLITILVSAAVIVLLGALLARTTLGVSMRAAAENFEVARLLGVSANKVIATGFILSGFLAAAVAWLLVIRSSTVSTEIGLQPVLIAFVATVVGGMGNLWGAAAGGALLGVTSVVFQTLLPADLAVARDAFVYASVIVILLWRPQGLFPARHTTARV